MNVPFTGHLALLGQFLGRRTEIADAVERNLLNERGREALRAGDRRRLEQLLNACFFGLPGLSRDPSELKGQLAAAHVADGFEPVRLDQYSNELDPLDLVVRAHHDWERGRRPGRSGRLALAQSIFTVFVLHQIELLSLRIWDEGDDHSEARLEDVQRLLDTLNDPSAPVVLVRDARWLIQTAQGPLTLRLEPYFRIARRIAASLPAARRLEVHKAGAKLAGGHLRSQLRYRVWRSGRPIDDPELLGFMRNANAMDVALLVHDLVPLLEAYRTAWRAHDPETRLDVADAILQGLSADPELCLTRLDLLAPFTMIEEVFIERGGDGCARYSQMGDAHLRLLERYGDLIADLADPLREDAARLDPSTSAYSPLGITYGFITDLLSNMALGTPRSQPSFGLSLEDMFASRGDLGHKLARAEGWAALPRRQGEQQHFDHSSEWAAQMFARLMQALGARALHGAVPNASDRPDARIFAVADTGSVESPPEEFLPAVVLPAHEYCFTSDVNRAVSNGATPYPKSQMASDRSEGRFLASAESEGKWFAVSKIILTLFTGQGKHALIAGVPPSVIEVLRLMCPALLVEPIDETAARRDA